MRGLSISGKNGFSLIEVLITVFVAAIGLLTVAGLQAMSKKVNYDAAQRTSATTLAQDIIERMRANPQALDSYATTDATAVTTSTDCDAATACTPAQLAGYDKKKWGQSLLGTQESVGGAAAGGLVSPTGCISGSSGLYKIAIAWRGVMPVDPPGSSEPGHTTCGDGKSVYDDPDASGTDYRMRRVIIVNAFIANPYAP